MISVARFLLAVAGAVRGFCLSGMKMLWAPSLSSTTGSHLCSFGTLLCLHLSQQEAERGLMNGGAENDTSFRVAKGKLQTLTVLVNDLQQGSVG